MTLYSLNPILVQDKSFWSPVPVPADSPQLPAPPSGYTWEWSVEMKAGFLRPEDWHVLKETKNQTQALFITQEQIHRKDQEKGFQTGLTVNRIPGAGQKFGGLASQFAAAFVHDATKVMQNVLTVIAPQELAPSINMRGYRVQQDGAITHTVLVCDDRVDLTYLVIFESPRDNWDTAWRIGEPIIQKMMILF